MTTKHNVDASAYPDYRDGLLTVNGRDFTDTQLQLRLSFLLGHPVGYVRDEALGETRLTLSVNSTEAEQRANRFAEAIGGTELEPSVVVIEHENARYDAATGQFVYGNSSQLQ
jgi:hypothetical protein